MTNEIESEPIDDWLFIRNDCPALFADNYSFTTKDLEVQNIPTGMVII